MSLARELVDLIRFFRRTPPAARRIVFYAEHEGYYACFEGLVEELLEKRRVPVCYVTSDAGDPILRTERSGLRTFYLKRLLSCFMRLVRCRVFVMTLTDLHRFYLKRSVHPVHYVYVFHSMVSTHMMYRRGAFDHYDSILCAGPYHVREIAASERLGDLPPKELVAAGYYRLERIHTEYLKLSDRPADRRTGVTVLIAPSWGETNLLKTCGRSLIKLLLERRYRVIVRPHPETVRRDRGLLENLRREFAEQAAFSMEQTVATDDSLLTADILICDLSGVALEYALGTERPVLFVDVPPKIQNPDYTELVMEPVELAFRETMGEVVSPSDLSEIPGLIDSMISRRPHYRERLLELRGKLISEFGRSSEVGADHILQVAADAENLSNA